VVVEPLRVSRNLRLAIASETPSSTPRNERTHGPDPAYLPALKMLLSNEEHISIGLLEPIPLAIVANFNYTMLVALVRRPDSVHHSRSCTSARIKPSRSRSSTTSTPRDQFVDLSAQGTRP
jgi:hypothetical protein